LQMLTYTHLTVKGHLWASDKSSDTICFCDHVKGLGGV
jgi:hypothetical protein